MDIKNLLDATLHRANSRMLAITWPTSLQSRQPSSISEHASTMPMGSSTAKRLKLWRFWDDTDGKNYLKGCRRDRNDFRLLPFWTSNTMHPRVGVLLCAAPAQSRLRGCFCNISLLTCIRQTSPHARLLHQLIVRILPGVDPRDPTCSSEHSQYPPPLAPP